MPDRSERERLFDAIAQHSTDSFALLDREGRIRFINRPAPGRTLEQVLGTSILDYVPEGERDGVRACIERVITTGEPDWYSSVYARPDGRPSFWESRVTPVLEDGVITGVAAVSTDVTERREAMLERDRVFDLTADLLCVIGFDGRFERVNPAFTAALGYELGELLYRPFLDFVYVEDREPTALAFASLTQGRDGVFGFENRYVHADGSLRRLEWTAYPDHATARVVAAARDVTQQRALEEQLRQSQKMEAVGQLAGGIAHDFNNLMQAILSNVHFALATAPAAPVREFLADIDAAALRASKLTSQLLSFGRRQPLEIRTIDLGEFTRDLVRLLRRVIPEDIEIHVDESPSLAPIAGDPSRLEQLIMNLCLNARDAMPDGGRLTIHTSTEDFDEDFVASHPWARTGRFVRLSIADDGVGMSPQVRARVFEPFFTTKDLGDGTGLGLAVAYGVIEQHGGLVQVASTPGGGTTFDVYFPASAARSAAPTPVAGIRPLAGGRETILLAEDEELVRRAVVRLLEGAGYRVIAAANGREAVELCRAHETIDLALLDLVMPELGGAEALELIRVEHPGLPAIFVSGYSGRARGSRAIPPDAVIVNKPFELSRLLHAIRAALD